MKKLYLFLSLGFYIIFIMAGCTTDNNLFYQLDEAEKLTTNLTNDPLKGEYNVVREFDIEMSNFAFSKNILNVELGQKVRIKLINTNGFHNFVIDELNVKSSITTTNEIEYVEFITTTRGEFKYYSSHGDDNFMGMNGILYIQ